jgi:hypothetical protein
VSVIEVPTDEVVVAVVELEQVEQPAKNCGRR